MLIDILNALEKIEDPSELDPFSETLDRSYQDIWYDHVEELNMDIDKVRWGVQEFDNHQKLGDFLEYRNQYNISRKFIDTLSPSQYTIDNELVREIHIWKGATKHEGGSR